MNNFTVAGTGVIFALSAKCSKPKPSPDTNVTGTRVNLTSVLEWEGYFSGVIEVVLPAVSIQGGS